MNIEKKRDNNTLTIALEGRLDTTTAPAFEAEAKENLEDVKCLIVDMDKLEYLSSAGLRVLLSLEKIMKKQGKMIVRNVNEIISEVFEATGFDDILTIE